MAACQIPCKFGDCSRQTLLQGPSVSLPTMSSRSLPIHYSLFASPQSDQTGATPPPQLSNTIFGAEKLGAFLSKSDPRKSHRRLIETRIVGRLPRQFRGPEDRTPNPAPPFLQKVLPRAAGMVSGGAPKHVSGMSTPTTCSPKHEAALASTCRCKCFPGIVLTASCMPPPPPCFSSA